MEVIENNQNLPKYAIFNLSIMNDIELIGNLTIYEHPLDKNGGQVHLEIVPKWRCRWLTRSLKEIILFNLIKFAKKYQLLILYSTAFAEVSPRLLDFFGFKEYHKAIPKTYYYLTI